MSDEQQNEQPECHNENNISDEEQYNRIESSNNKQDPVQESTETPVHITPREVYQSQGIPMLIRPPPQQESFFQRLLKRGFAVGIIVILCLLLWWWWSNKSGGEGNLINQIVDQTKRVVKLPPQM